MLHHLIALMAGATGTHRYWRLTNFAIPHLGASLDISELAVFQNGVDVTASATKTASSNPTGNNLTNLWDGSLINADVNWAAATVPSLWIKFEFPTSVVINGIKQGTWSSATRWIERFTLEHSDDNSVWTPAFSRGMLPDPGSQVLSSLYEPLPVPPSGHRYWRINGITTGSSGTGNLELSEFDIFESGVAKGSTATKSFELSTNQTPYIGAVANWTDNNLSNRFGWFAADAQHATWQYRFDFGAGNYLVIDGAKQGGFDTAANFAAAFTLQYSDDGANWTTLGSKSGLSYPGNNTLSSLYTFP